MISKMYPRKYVVPYLDGRQQASRASSYLRLKMRMTLLVKHSCVGRRSGRTVVCRKTYAEPPHHQSQKYWIVCGSFADSLGALERPIGLSQGNDIPVWRTCRIV